MPGTGTRLRRAQQDGRPAFDRLQKSMEPRVRRFITRLVGKGARVHDIVQDTFLALFLKVERIESEEHLWPFVFRVARNLCYDELRRQHRFEIVVVNHGSERSDGSHIPVAAGSRPDELAHWVMAVASVKNAVDRLPEAQRQTLILRFEEHLTYEETAEAMSVDIGTVKSRIHHARKNLRDLLTPAFLRALGFE